MFVNKIGNGLKNQQVFKGYQHEIDDAGVPVMRFNYPFDYVNNQYSVRLYNVKENPDRATGFEVILSKEGVNSYPITQNGVVIDLRDVDGLNLDKAFAYQIVQSNGNKFTETGIQEDECSIVTTLGTTPVVQGAGVLSMPDLHRPGAYYDKKTGKVLYDPEKQKDSESMIRNFANAAGGNLAGYEYELDLLDNPDTSVPKILKDVKVFYSTPVAGGDNRSGFRYWNKNNMGIDRNMGSSENYDNFIKKMYQHGKIFVYDGTYTSEGLEGIHFQYAVRWGDKNPQTAGWFRMTGLKDAPLGYGVIPKHPKNLRHKVINAPSIIDPKTGKVVDNPNYDANKETLFQIYDGSQVTDKQAADLDKPIDIYRKLKSGNPLAINTHDDTIISYVFEVKPKEYTQRLKAFVNCNKKSETPIELNSPEGTALIAQFTNFKLIRKKDGGFVTWDANTDMVKMNYHMSGYDEKILKAIVDPSQRDYETTMTERGAIEVQDYTLQAARYWTRKSREVQTLYTAQMLQNASTKGEIDKLIKEGKLPKEAELTEGAVLNIVDNFYRLDKKGIQNKDDITVKALMNLPLDSLEFGENTQGVLSTSFFSSRAVLPEQRGLTRFELMQQGDPHLVQPYADNYSKMNDLYTNELKNFADLVINKVNETSSEKLLDEKGNYTEYGEYIIDLLGRDIAKYAFLKAVGGSNTEAFTWKDGTITYDYDKLAENTTIKALGIRAHSPADEAAELRKIMERGLRHLGSDDVDFVAKSVSQRIAGTNTTSFRLAEAMVRKAGLGLAIRLDAIKDIIDMDAVRNRDLTFDQAWDQLIDFCALFVKTVKKENPNAYIVAEITDIEQLMKAMFGESINPHTQRVDIGNKYKNVQEAMMQFYLKTGITSEAGYSYTFTNLLQVFSPDFVDGGTRGMVKFMTDFYNILSSRGVDYIRNLWTFADNHDKPSVMHGMALDMNIFNANIFENNYAKETLMKLLCNADDISELPLEAQFFIHDNNYYRLASTKAAAMSKLMRDCINELDINNKEKDLLKQAVSKLTNGNYLGEGPEFKLAFDDNEPISTLEGALTNILAKAGITLSSEQCKEILKIAQSKIGHYFGDKNPNSPENLRRLKLILSGEANAPEHAPEGDYKEYSLYTASIALALREGFHSVLTNVDITTQKKFWLAEKAYIQEFNAAYIKEQQAKVEYQEDSEISRRKDGYAARDFETVIKMIIEEAEFLGHQQGKLDKEEHLSNRDAILADLFKKTTEPAVKKAVMYMSFLSALPGIPTVYARDMLGALGFDEKTKNIFLQNRNVIPWSELEEGPLKEYRTQILKDFMEALEIRTLAGDPLNQGTPYRASTSAPEIPAIMMQNGYGDVCVSVFDAKDVNHGNRNIPVQGDNGIDYILFGTGLVLPLGLEFKNIFDKDQATYIVSDIVGKDGKYAGRGLKVKGGDYIALNKDTLKNGVMVLRHIAKRVKQNVNFKGNSIQINKQYNIVSNPYKKIEIPQEGQNLSIIAR